jgi:hypothetical protein
MCQSKMLFAQTLFAKTLFGPGGGLVVQGPFGNFGFETLGTDRFRLGQLRSNADSTTRKLKIGQCDNAEPAMNERIDREPSI